MRALWIALISSSICACGAAGTRAPIGSSLDAPLSPRKAEGPPPKPAVPDDVVERAARPFHATRTLDGETLDQRQFFDELARFDVLCLGEAHDAPRDHYAELSITQ